MDNIGDELSTFTEAMSFEQTGDYNAAAEIYQHLVTLERIKDNSDYSILVDYLNRAGYCFQKSNDVTKSQQCFREAQDLRQNIIIEKEISANLDYNPNLYESLSDFDKDFIGKTELELIDLVAKLQGKAKRFEESKKPNLAAAHYAKLLELAKRVRSISNDDLIKYAEKAAFNLQNAKCFRQALYYYTEAVRLNIKEKKYNSIAMNYNNMSFLYLQYQNYSAALKYCQQSLKFNKKINNTYQISLNLSNLGQIYRKQKNYEKALSSFEQAVALKIKLGKRKDIAHEVYHIAEVYRDQGQYKDAIAKINTALSIVNDVETRKIALYNDLLGELYTKQNQPETALQYFTKALSTYTVHSKWKASEVLSKICAIYREQQDFANLVTYLEKNLHINTEINDENKIEVLLREIAHVLYEQKEYEQAKEYFSKIIVSHEQKGRAKSFSAYYQDLHTLAAWHKQLQQYSESFNLLQKALNTAKKTNYGSVEVTLHCIGNVYLVQQESERALRAYEQAVEESNDWYKNVLHLVAIAATHAQKNDIEVANEYYQKAQEKILQNRKTDDILYLETLKDEEQRFLEFKSYYLQAYIYAKVAKLSSDDAIKFHLQAINLFKDLCAVDSKNIYEDNCEKQDIDIEINKQQCLVEQINYLTSTCAELIEQQQQDVVLEAIELLFDSNESIYGIEYCEDLLKLCSEIISARQLTNYFFQMGLRYFQLQEYSKSLVSYAKSVGVSQDFHDEKTQNALKKILSILRKQQILFDDEVASTLGKCIEVAENSDLFAQLLKSLCLLYKESATPERGAHYFTIALEELSESDRQFVIDFLRTLTDRYTALGERDKVLQVQEDLLRLEHGVKQTDFLEEIDCEKTQRMAHTFLSLNEYDKALENFVLLEKEYRKQSQKQYLAQTLLNIGRIHGYMANVKNALESLHEALTISREINDRELIGEVLQSINNVYVQNQDIEGALHYNLSMLDLDRRYGFKPFIILDLYHISKLYINKRDFAAAISYAEEALQIIHDHKQSTIVDTTEVLILLEDLYTHTENSAKLIDVYMQLIALHKKAREEDMILTYKDLLLRACEKYYAKVQNMTSVEKSLENQESLFNAFIYLARAKSKQGLVESSSYEKSVASLREACQIYQNLKNYVSPRNKHIVYDEMVQCQEGLSQSLLALGDYHMNFETYADAVFFYAENIEVRKEMNDPQSLVDSCLRLANAYQKQRQLQESLEALLQALKYCQESGIEQEEMRLYNKISQLYLTLGEQEKAFEYSEKVVNFYRQISQTAPLHVNEDLLSEAKNVTATIKENTKKQGRDFTLSIEGQLPKSDRSQ